jgi:hypothetical protein
LRVPGIAGLALAIAGTAVVAGAGERGALIAGIIAVIASVVWLLTTAVEIHHLIKNQSK